MDINEAAYREHGPALLAYLCARVPLPVAEELHHDVWVRALKEPRQLTGIDLRRWLFEVAGNAAVDYVRKASTRREKTSLSGGEARETGTTGSVDPLVRKEEFDKMLACIQQLPEQFRDVVKGRLAGESSEETALRLRINRATVDTRFHRARERLEECTKDGASLT